MKLLYTSFCFSCVHFQAIKHENINRPKSPCVDNNQYNFEFCVERHIVMKAGCQPYWNKFNMKGIQICKNGSMLNHYSNERTTISLMSREELIETTKCLMPCSFMEYKVSVYQICTFAQQDNSIFDVCKLCSLLKKQQTFQIHMTILQPA